MHTSALQVDPSPQPPTLLQLHHPLHRLHFRMLQDPGPQTWALVSLRGRSLGFGAGLWVVGA